MKTVTIGNSRYRINIGSNHCSYLIRTKIVSFNGHRKTILHSLVLDAVSVRHCRDDHNIIKTEINGHLRLSSTYVKKKYQWL